MKRLLVLLLILFIQIPTFAQTNQDIIAQACQESFQADAKLNQVYQAIMKRYKSDQLTVGKIRTAQQAWLKYRDAHLNALYPGDPVKGRDEYGSLYSMCVCQELAEITRHRTQELETWLNNQEGNLCSGSRSFSNNAAQK